MNRLKNIACSIFTAAVLEVKTSPIRTILSLCTAVPVMLAAGEYLSQQWSPEMSYISTQHLILHRTVNGAFRGELYVESGSQIPITWIRGRYTPTFSNERRGKSVEFAMQTPPSLSVPAGIEILLSEIPEKIDLCIAVTNRKMAIAHQHIQVVWDDRAGSIRDAFTPMYRTAVIGLIQCNN